LNSSASFSAEEAVRQMVLPSWWLSRRQKVERVETARQVIDDFLEDCIESRLAIWGTDEISSRNTTDLLNILLEAERDGAISRDEVKGQLLQFVFAGFDTLAPTLTFMLWEVRGRCSELLQLFVAFLNCQYWTHQNQISQNQQLQSDLLTEAKAALQNKQDFPMKPDSLMKQVPLMDATFSETNRKHPAAAMGASRKVGRKPIVVGDGLELPADASVLISPWTLHRNERFWEDPERFDPSRFENPPKDPFSYQPFSGGPRNCIGIKLARAETLSLFVPLIRRFHVKSTSQRVPDDYFTLTRRPRRPVTFILTTRED
jgi:cytochrome P450